MEQPAWLAVAWQELGVREGPGRANEGQVLGYYRDAGHGEISSDDVPWCAAFVGAMLKRAGVAPSGSLMARSYLAWGQRLDEARIGAIAVLERGGDPSAGHTGFVVGEAGSKIILLGGNQSDAVCVAAFDKSRLLACRWPPEPSAEAAPADWAPVHEGTPANGDAFDLALSNVLQLEGGFSDDPYDPGGPTNKGVTLAVFARFKGVTVNATTRARLIEDLKEISDAAVRSIYRARYWEPAQCAAMPVPLALFHFDAAVNHGVSAAARMLQSVVGVPADGEIGPVTLDAILKRDPNDVLADYAEIRRQRYRALPHFWRFGRGWLKRVDISLARAKELITAENHLSENQKGGSAMEQSDVATGGKWWAQSKTIWGALITAAAAVVPILGPIAGIELSGEVVRQAGEQTFAAIQACVGLFGTLLTIYGRLKADGPLVRRDVSVKL